MADWREHLFWPLITRHLIIYRERSSALQLIYCVKSIDEAVGSEPDIFPSHEKSMNNAVVQVVTQIFYFTFTFDRFKAENLSCYARSLVYASAS